MREILKELLMVKTFGHSLMEFETDITQAIAAIKAELKEKLPKEKEIKKEDWELKKEDWEQPITFGDVIYAENSIIRIIHKIIDEME